MAWEELQKQERDSKYSALKEKVILQRELISRQDQQLATSSRLAAVTQVLSDGCTAVTIIMYCSYYNNVLQLL